MSDPAANTTIAPAGADESSVQLANKLSQVNHKSLKFIIMDRPTEFNLPSYLRELKKAVRACLLFSFLKYISEVYNLATSGKLARFLDEIKRCLRTESAVFSFHLFGSLSCPHNLLAGS